MVKTWKMIYHMYMLCKIKVFSNFFFGKTGKTGKNRKNLTLHNIDMWYIIFHVETMGRSILTLVLENCDFFFKLADFLHKILNFWIFLDFLIIYAKRWSQLRWMCSATIRNLSHTPGTKNLVSSFYFRYWRSLLVWISFAT